MFLIFSICRRQEHFKKKTTVFEENKYVGISLNNESVADENNTSYNQIISTYEYSLEPRAYV